MFPFGTRPDSTTGAVGRLKEAYVYEQNGGEKNPFLKAPLFLQEAIKEILPITWWFFTMKTEMW